MRRCERREAGSCEVAERVEQGSSRVLSAVKLTAKVVLKNSSKDQTVRLVAGQEATQSLDVEQPLALRPTRNLSIIAARSRFWRHRRKEARGRGPRGGEG